MPACDREVIMRIAAVASQFAANANIGGCETAGLIVSYLSANPEKIDDFMKRGEVAMLDDERFRWENGSLSWHGRNNQIVTPSELRKHLGRNDA